MKQLITKLTALIFLLLTGFVAQAQNGAGQPYISSDYEGVTAKYVVLATGTDESIAVKYKNNTASTCLIVLNINNRAGMGERKTFIIKPFANLFENIGDINSVFVSSILYKEGSGQESQLIGMAKQREKIVKSNGLLKSQKNITADVQTPALPGAEGEQSTAITEVDYLGVKGSYKKWQGGSKAGIFFTFKNTRTDLEAVVTVKANGAILRKEALLPGAEFSGNSTNAVINIEVDFNKIPDRSVSEIIWQEIKSKSKSLLKDLVIIDKNDKDKIKSQHTNGTVFGPRG